MSAKIEHKIINGVEQKLCSRCKQWLPIESFNKNKKSHDKLKSWCKECVKQHNKQYKEDNKKSIKIKTKIYRQKNRKKIKATEDLYLKNNAEKVKNRQKKYRKNNKEKIKLNRIEYSKKNKGKRNTYHKQYKLLYASSKYMPKICKYEQTRYCTGDNSLLEVKCAYCGGWFKPTNLQIQQRIKAINSSTDGELRLYCSDNCKNACPTYRRHMFPRDFKQATSREVVPLLRQLVLERDNYMCQKCEATTETAQLHVHHIIPYAQNKMQANDPDSCITLCKSCHEEIHQQEGCKYNELKCKKA